MLPKTSRMRVRSVSVSSSARSSTGFCRPWRAPKGTHLLLAIALIASECKRSANCRLRRGGDRHDVEFRQPAGIDGTRGVLDPGAGLNEDRETCVGQLGAQNDARKGPHLRPAITRPLTVKVLFSPTMTVMLSTSGGTDSAGADATGNPVSRRKVAATMKKISMMNTTSSMGVRLISESSCSGIVTGVMTIS